MKLKRLKLRGFTKHTDTELHIPDRGIVLVVGANGSGKSSCVDGVATAFWNKTLRGESPWVGQEGAVEAETYTGLSVVRSYKKGKVSLNVTGTPIYETPSKAQDALDGVIPTFDLWRRSCVFSSDDATSFAKATPSERSRLFETILALDSFDPGLSACKADLRVSEQASAAASAKVAALEAKLSAAKQRASDARRILASMPPGGEIAKPDLSAIDARILEATASVMDAQSRLSGLNRSDGASSARLDELNRRLQKLKADACFTCGQTIPDALRATLRDEIAETLAVREEENTKAAESRRGIEKELAQATKLKQDAVAAKATEAAEYAEYTRTLATRTTANKTLTTAAQEIEALADALIDAEQELSDATRSTLVLQHAAKALGIKGIRAQILTRAVGGLELAAQDWLLRICGDSIKIKFAASREKADGTTADEITMHIDIDGGGKSYWAASNGERRRINTAIMFALAQLAEQSSGHFGSTTVFDEALDNLDDDGISAILPVVSAYSEDRCCIVISHNKDIISKLPWQQLWETEQGKVKVKHRSAS